jgi:hypothetical protein
MPGLQNVAQMETEGCVGTQRRQRLKIRRRGNSVQGSTKVVSTYEYHIVINDAQRRLIMRALTD